MKKIILLVVLSFVFITGCSNGSTLPEQINSFKIRASVRSDDGRQVDFRTSVFVDDKGRVKIAKIYQQPSWGSLITYKTKDSALSETELIRFKELLSQDDIFSFDDLYRCSPQAIDIKECYINEPFLQSAGLNYIKFNLDGREKEIEIWASNGVPETLKNIMKEIIGIRDRLSSIPWNIEVSEHDELFD